MPFKIITQCSQFGALILGRRAVEYGAGKLEAGTWPPCEKGAFLSLFHFLYVVDRVAEDLGVGAVFASRGDPSREWYDLGVGPCVF